MTSSTDQLIYISRATQHIDRGELLQITARSQANNGRLGVSGALLFCNGYFLQILEGERATLDALLDKIGLDERHADVHVIERSHGIVRLFGDWSMACVHESALSDAQLAKVHACVELIRREELVDRIGNDAHQLLVELREALSAEPRFAQAA